MIGPSLPNDFRTVLLLRSMARDADRLPPEIVVDYLRTLAEMMPVAGTVMTAFDDCVAALPEHW